MARTLNGTSDNVEYSSIAFGGTGCYLLWVDKDFADNDADANYLMDSTNGDRYLIYKRKGDTPSKNHYGLYLDNTAITDEEDGLLGMLTQASGFQSVACNYTSGAQEVFADGTSIDTMAITITGSTPTNHWLGKRYTDVEFWEGKMAYFVVWNVELTDNEHSALGNGVNPFVIRKSNQLVHSPLNGNNSPENDYSGNGKTGTLDGTSKSSLNPPVEFLENYL